MHGYHSRRLLLGVGLTLFSTSLLPRGAFAQLNAGDLLKGAAGLKAGNLGAGLGQGEIGAGLKDMLKVTAREAIGKVGRPNGFSGDPAVRIPLPGVLEQARQPLSMMGQGGMLNDLSQRMNRGAEQAAPKALGIFNKAATNISFDDARQILINLLSNAIKFTPDGGSITVGALEKAGSGVEIYVADTGIGMTQAQIEKAFSVYGQVDSRIARTHEGTGLGLPISQSLAQLQGGDLLAQSTPGRGTRMTFVLPESRIVREPLIAVG